MRHKLRKKSQNMENTRNNAITLNIEFKILFVEDSYQITEIMTNNISTSNKSYGTRPVAISR